MDKRFIARFLKGSAAASLGQFATIFFHFLSIMLLTRIMPKADFGIYLLILVVVHFLKILSGLGLDLTLVRFIAAGRTAREEGVLGSILLLRALVIGVLGFLVYTFGHLLTPLLDEAINDYLALIPLIVFFMSFRELFFFLFQGLHAFKKYAAVQVASALLKFGLILLALQADRLSISTLLYIEVIAYAGSLAIQLLLTPLGELGGLTFRLKAIRESIRFAVPLYLNNLLTFFYDRVNVFLIGAWLNPVSIAYFEVAGRIPDGFARIFNSFIVVYFPNLSTLFAEGKTGDAEQVMNTSLEICAMLLSFLALCGFAFGEDIVTLVFSARYREAAPAFSLLMVSFLLRALSNIMGYSLVSAGHSGVPVRVNIISSSINLTLSLLLIPRFGFMGAVYSLIIMNAVSELVYLYFLNRKGIRADASAFLKPMALALFLLIPYLLLDIRHPLWRLCLPLTFLAVAGILLPGIRKVMLLVWTRLYAGVAKAGSVSQ